MSNEKPKIFTVPAILTGISYKADGGLSLRFSTNELASEDKVSVSAFYNAFGYLGFKENGITLADLPKEDAEDKQKTPSKRLRAALFVLAKQRGIKDFETWYKVQMEKVIERVKAELD